MDTQNVQQEAAESDVVTFLRRGMISILDAIAVKLPDVFTAEILPKLDVTDTLNLAQVNKDYNAAVWSADGVRSLKAKASLALICAATYGNVPAVRALLESGVDMNKSFTSHVLPSIIEYTALHVAVRQGRVAVVKALIEAGPDVNKTAGDNRTALHIAATVGQASCAVELIKAGADVNLAWNDGDTPLALAVKNGHDVIVGMLILAGADVGKAVNHSRAMIALAKSLNTKAPEHENIVKALEHFGA
tara:strand:+ start:268 stop:1008 length:741 start_codon:yes stop_codon:yes gene_type:complete